MDENTRLCNNENMSGKKAAKEPAQVKEETTVVGVRLPWSLVTVIDRECVDLMEQFPGKEFTRTDFLRMALREFLDTKKFRIKVRERVRAGQ